MFLFFQFAVILLALFIGKVAIGTFAFIQVSSADDPDGIKTLVNKHVSELVRTYSSQNASRETMDLIQQEVKYFLFNQLYFKLNNFVIKSNVKCNVVLAIVTVVM